LGLIAAAADDVIYDFAWQFCPKQPK